MTESLDFDLSGTIITVQTKEEALKLRYYAFSKGFHETTGFTSSTWGREREFSFLPKKEIVTGSIYEDEYNLKRFTFKDILKHNLERQLEKAKEEVERIENLIMEENKPKIGDWCKFWDNDKSVFIVGKLERIYKTKPHPYLAHGIAFKNCEKITNAELIKLLENEQKI